MAIIDVSQVRTASRFPEILPGTVIRDIPGGGEASPLPIDLRRYGRDRLLQLRELYLDRNPDLRYSISGDDFNIERRASAVDDGRMRVNISAFDNLVYRLHNEDPAVMADVRTYFSLLITRPTVALKLKFNRELTDEEQQINEEFDIEESVDEGFLPLPFNYMFHRQYHTVNKFVVSSRIDTVPAVGHATFEDLSVEPGHALILTEVAADPFAVADDLRIRVDRDNDIGYFDVRPAAINSLDDSINVFVPAIREIRFRAVAENVLNDVDVRLMFNKVKLTDILRVRWGIIEPEDAPDDLGRKVLGGVV